jgi:energy-coupling factor transporter ATP-binding protein EcfA2
MEIISYLKKLNKETGITIIVVTHDRRFERMTDFSFNIMDGAIASYRIAGKETDEGLTEVVRHEMSFVDQFGMVKIPPALIGQFNIKKFVKIEEDEDGDITLVPQD